MNEWIDIKVKFPPLDKILIVCVEKEMKFFNPSGLPNPARILKEHVTHWMLLPELPDVLKR